MNEHDDEPVPGLPGVPPEGETVLWQGAPDFAALARRFHLRGLALYFAAIWAYSVASTGGADVRAWLLPPLLSAVALGLVAGYAALVARTTRYTVTNRRVAIRFGVALSMTVNIPFRQIDGAGLLAGPDGAGDLPLTLVPDAKLAYLVMWPHVRPWHVKHAQPMLRAVTQPGEAARALARALAAHAGVPVQAIDATTAAHATGARPVAA